MNVSEAIKTRRTVRGFKPDPVPEDLLRTILEEARYSASNCNTQPWHFSVVSGAARNRLEQILVEEILHGTPPYPDFKAGDDGLTGVYQ